jgi:riboflavin synthase alpha subunit
MVQGHVDQVGNCIEATETNGSWSYTFWIRSCITKSHDWKDPLP